MKEILDIAVWVGFAFILFIFLRGMNDTQVQKHKEKLEEAQKREEAKQTQKEKQEEKKDD